MNGWMPRLSERGVHVMSGMGTWTLDGQDMGPGYMPMPLDADRLIVYREDAPGLWAYTPAWSAWDCLAPGIGLNGLAAGAGHWAYYNADGITFDSGGWVDGYEPAIWGAHYAYVTGEGNEARLYCDGAEVWYGPILTTTTPPRVRAGPPGLTWISNGIVWGLRWGQPWQVLAPDWRPAFFSVPISGPNDEPWLIVSSEHPATSSARVALVPWGSCEGIVVADRPGLLHPDAAWTGSDWRVVACDGSGQLYEWRIDAGTPRTDLSVDDRPPMPQPIVGFVADPQIGPAPLDVTGIITVKQNVQTLRWMLDGYNAPLPNDRDSYSIQLNAVGGHALAVKAQGVPADAAHLPDSGGQVVTTPTQYVTVTEPVPVPPDEAFRLGVVCWAEQEQPDTYAKLAWFGWQTIRLACEHVPDERIAAAVAVPEAAGLRVIVVLSPERVVSVPNGHDWEPFNEPDGGPDGYVAPSEVIRRVLAQLPVIRAKALRVWLPAIMNPSPGGLAYMRTVLAAMPEDVGADLHRYPQDRDTPPSQPRKGYSSRSAEMAAVKAAIGNRRFVVTESDYVPGIDRHGWWIFGHTHRCTEAQQARWEAEEAAIWRQAGAVAWCHYQINGASGLRRDDGTWRPVASLPRSGF